MHECFQLSEMHLFKHLVCVCVVSPLLHYFLAMLEPTFRLLCSEMLPSNVVFAIFFAPISPFQRLSCASEGLKLSAATLRNLEILNNQVNTQPKHLHLDCSAQVRQPSVRPMFLLSMLLVDRRRSEGQSAVGAGPHQHPLWPEADEKMGEPTSQGRSVSILRFV